MKKISWMCIIVVGLLLLTSNLPAAASRVELKAPSAEEEGGFLLHVLSRLKFYRDNGYTVGLPDQDSFKKWIKMANDGKKIDRDKFISEFKKNIFKPEDYDQSKTWLSSHSRDVERAVDAASRMVRSLGGRTYPEYQVLLTLYGPGGNYDPDGGTIHLLTSNPNPIVTIAHEVVHIGIEESVIKRFDLTHWEKERLVDIICAQALKGVIPYKIDWARNMPIDDYATAAKLSNLSASLKRYVKDYPRDLN